jgi:hypothetical protein
VIGGFIHCHGGASFTGGIVQGDCDLEVLHKFCFEKIIYVHGLMHLTDLRDDCILGFIIKTQFSYYFANIYV